MPRSRASSGHGGNGGDRGRYAAVVEKGDNAWKREWSSFMSGLNLKRLRDGTSGVALKASADIERQLGAMDAALASSPVAGVHESGGDVEVNEDGIPLGAIASRPSFSYLFASPADRRAEREARDRAAQECHQALQRELTAKKDPLRVMSKHQRALLGAEQRGLQLDGMTRKERREFLHLTVTEAQRKAAEQSREFKLHDLMDDKLAWYQQGPHPIDLIAEKLVRRKAEKKAKQLGLKYNYLAPHPSWLAKRAQRRRESLLVGLGKRLVFSEKMAGEGNDADTAVSASEVMVTDPLHHLTVPLRQMGLLLGHHSSAASTAVATADAAVDGDADAMVEAAAGSSTYDGMGGATGADEEEAQHLSGEAGRRHGGDAAGARKPSASTPSSAASTRRSGSSRPPKHALGETGDGVVDGAATHAGLPDDMVLRNPSRMSTSVVRSVVRDRTTALAMQQLNRTTNYLSSQLVRGPSLRPEDALLESGLPAQGLSVLPAATAVARTSSLKRSATALRRPSPSKEGRAAGSDRKRVRAAEGDDEDGEHRRVAAAAAAMVPSARKLKRATHPSSTLPVNSVKVAAAAAHRKSLKLN
ncbi:hypothetical protein LSCM1_05904 [Leishmania martiniquensis]|uniref:Uncharacterized protein n=1 Tax=Leishmania martiniquensis TaxID=1580590 RepID=A0A836HH66_9TRYP|nr:hypothetical protein LSCM1_05904 [Leishmania martiniquensis]